MAPLQFAYWVPNVSGGLVVSKIPQRTDHSLDYNVKLAQLAEENGFEFALTQIRFLAGYGASVSFSHAILAQTKKLNVIAAILPGPWNPTIAAKTLAGIDIYTGSRISVNVVSGWFKQEFVSIGEEWLEHDQRYKRSSEFIKCLRGIWNEEPFNFDGTFYKYKDYNLSPKPAIKAGATGNKPERGPTIFMGGNSVAARDMAAADSDWFFMNGNTDEVFAEYIADVRQKSHALGRKVKTAINGFVLVRDTEEEALTVLDEIVNGADKTALSAFQEAVKEAGQSSKEGQGMWATAGVKDLVQYNEGFRTGLIGTKEQVARRIVKLKSLGADLVLTCFLHFQDDVVQFGEQVLPLVRQYEQEAIDNGEAKLWPTFDNYPVQKEANGHTAPNGEAEREAKRIKTAA